MREREREWASGKSQIYQVAGSWMEVVIFRGCIVDETPQQIWTNYKGHLANSEGGKQCLQQFEANILSFVT